MGFKRTSEGRVFFQGADESAAPKKADFRSLSQNSKTQQQLPNGTAAGTNTQFQILTLLKSLNDKLKDSQTERAKMRAELDAYRKHIEDLEDKSERQERAYIDLEQKVGRPDKSSSAKVERAEKLAEDTFKELQETRKLLLELEDKTEKADKATLTLQRQLGQTRAMGEEIIRKQTSYEELVKRIDVTETKYEDLTEKVDKTAAEQTRILRQIEKVAEDRTRFMRKIERIEETVIQTRDALSAKAMVLLTEQGATAKSDAKPILGPASVVEQVVSGKPARERAEGDIPAWYTSKTVQAGIAASVLVLGIIGGWAVTKIQSPAQQTPSFQIGEAETPDATVEDNQSFDTAVSDETTSEAIADPYAEQAGPYTGLDASTATQDFPGRLPENDAANDATNDIGALNLQDEQKLIEMLDSNPDALAAELNKIEPGIASEEPAISETLKPAESVDTASLKVEERAPPPPAMAEPPQQKAKAQEKKPVEEKPVETKPAKPKHALSKRMKPDTSLPADVKQIETQAFDGIPEAQHDLAAIYTAGQGVRQDYKRAAFWFREAADQGIANARYNLGVLYHQGLGVKPDVKEAIQWYKSAADLGHPEAQYNLGIAYIEGIGVGYDPARAADNFEKAAQHGITEAAYNLGLIYENGLLGKPEPDQALRWYKTAADKGSPEAKEALEQLAKTLDINVEDVKRVADGVKPVKKSSNETVGKKAPATKTTAKLATPHGSQALLAQVQELLMRDGLYPGPADGVESPQTEDAIRSYQSANRLEVNGQPSQALLAHMLSNEHASTVND